MKTTEQPEVLQKKEPGRVSHEDPLGLIATCEDQLGKCACVRLHLLGSTAAGCGADLKAFPKLHTDPPT